MQGTARLRPKEQAGVRIVLSRLDAHAGSGLLSPTPGSQVRRNQRPLTSLVRNPGDRPAPKSWKRAQPGAMEMRTIWPYTEPTCFRTQRAAPRPTISKPPRCIRRGCRRSSPAWPGRESAATSPFQTHCPRRWSARRLGGFPVPGPSARSSPCRQRCACRSCRTRSG